MKSVKLTKGKKSKNDLKLKKKKQIKRIETKSNILKSWRMVKLKKKNKFQKLTKIKQIGIIIKKKIESKEK